MSKKAAIGLTAAVLAVIILAVIGISVVRGESETDTGKAVSGQKENSVEGTWYSDKPDSLIFTEDGTYQGMGWQEGEPWLIGGIIL